MRACGAKTFPVATWNARRRKGEAGGAKDRLGSRRRSAARRRSEHRQLSLEGPLERRPRFASDDIGGEIRIFLQDARGVQSAHHGYRQEVTAAERAVEPVGFA